MQRVCYVTFKCGHLYPFVADKLDSSNNEHIGLIRTLEELLCPDCIQDNAEKILALFDDLRKIGAVPLSVVTSEQLNIPRAWVDNVVRCLYDAAEWARKEGDALVGGLRGGLTVRMEKGGEITISGVRDIPGFPVDEFQLIIDSPHNCRGHLRDLLIRRWMVEIINTTIILTKGDIAYGQIRDCRKCPLALAINRYLKPEYFATVFHDHYSIQHRSSDTPIVTKSFKIWGEDYLIISAIDRGEKVEAPCKIKITLPKDALRIPRQTPRILPLP